MHRACAGIEGLRIALREAWTLPSCFSSVLAVRGSNSEDGRALVEFRIERLASSHVLSESLPLAEAAIQIARTRSSVYAVVDSGCADPGLTGGSADPGLTGGSDAESALGSRRKLRALFPEDLRFAAQDDFASDLVVGDLARADFVYSSEALAEGALRADPRPPGALVNSKAGDFVISRETPVVDTAILMAGGLGQRLRPLTDNLPKPLLEVGGVPLLLRTIELIRGHGVTKVFVSVNYLADKVKQAIGDGSQWDVQVEYLEESEPLDTGAGLALLKETSGPFFVLNGDILTDLDLTAMARQHHLAENLATIATYLFPAPLPYGVMHRDGDRIVEIEEKPVFLYPINAGMYLFSARALDFVKHGKPLAMVGFLNQLATEGEKVGRFALIEYWNDVGSHEDFERAQKDVANL